MSSKHIRTDVNFAWPTAEIAVMGPEGAVNILTSARSKRRRIRRRSGAKRVEEFREKFANPACAASRGFIDEVIRRQTRAKLIAALARLETKRDKNPPRSTATSRLTRACDDDLDRLANVTPPLSLPLACAGVEYLRATDLMSLAIGRHDSTAIGSSPSCRSITTRAVDQCVWEAHRSYIDVQCVVAGAERMGVAELASSTVRAPYDPARDVAFFEPGRDSVIVSAGMFAIFWPTTCIRRAGWSTMPRRGRSARLSSKQQSSLDERSSSD